MDLSQGKLRVCQFIDTYYPVVDGVVICVDNYARHLNAAGHYCSVVAPSFGAHDGEQEQNVLRCKSVRVPFVGQRSALPAGDGKLKAMIKAGNFDLLHAHSPFALGRYALKYAHKNGIPVVATFHTQFKMDFEKFIKSGFIVDKLVDYVVKFFNGADRVWAVTQASAGVLKSYGCNREIEVMDNGCDYEYPRDPAEKIAAADQNFGLSGIKNLLLYVGRPDTQKNIYMMLDGMKVLKELGIDYKFLIVGTSYEDDKVQRYIDKSGLTDNVTMLGRIYDREVLASLYLRADIFVIPSVYDTSSLVKQEAAAHKTPSILITGTPAATGVRDGWNGYLIPNDANALARKLADALSDKQSLAKVSQNAYDSLHKSWQSVIAEAAERYAGIIQDYKNHGAFVSPKQPDKKQGTGA